MSDNEKDPKNNPPKDSEANTDPQEKMEGPISSLMQNIKETGKENDEETKEEADRKQDKNK